jgi:hypothetical protein
LQQAKFLGHTFTAEGAMPLVKHLQVVQDFAQLKDSKKPPSEVSGPF